MTALAAWLLFFLALAVLGLFINIIMWRDDLAWRDWIQEDLDWETEQANLLSRQLDAASDEITELEMQLAFALEQLYAKATLEDGLEGTATVVVVSDHELQSLASDPQGTFSFERLALGEVVK